jgi:glycosyltransferase involved in cell wall biosynthesis
VEFWIAGEGPLHAQISSFPGPPNLSVRLLGHLDYDRLPGVYAQTGILVFPTLADEWGLVVVEAMAAGLPVLGSLYSQAVEELVVSSQNGWTFKPDEPQSFRDALNLALTAQSVQLSEMAACARQRVVRLTPADMASAMMAAIEYATQAS